MKSADYGARCSHSIRDANGTFRVSGIQVDSCGVRGSRAHLGMTEIQLLGERQMKNSHRTDNPVRRLPKEWTRLSVPPQVSFHLALA